MTAIPTEEAPEPLQSAKYLYDGDGNLVKSVVNSTLGNTTTTYYPGKHYNVEEKNDNLKVQKHYAAGSTVIAVRTITAEADTLQWMISDHLGSTSTTANADGTWNSDIRYTAFGEIRLKTGVTATGYRYTGQLDMQGSIGLDYYVARFYDPQLARFAQADTINPDPKNTLNFDRYAYVHNNPIRNNDPTGHICKQYVGSTCVAYSNDTWTPSNPPVVRPKFSWPPKELTQTMAFQPEFNKETYQSTRQNEWNNCGSWSVGADIPGIREVIETYVINSLKNSLGDKYTYPFDDKGKGIQPSLLASAAASAYGGNVWSKNNATVQDILDEIAKGNQVVVDIEVIEYYDSNGKLIGEPASKQVYAAHFARVLGVDLVNNVIYLTNSIGGDAYWTLSVEEFLAASTDPERRADSTAENVNQWILVFNTGK